ncbi:hypothetical protein [Arenicella xantha]|uniref:Uncharacterized protein n=1 Tax=Arenicella xantha TaxID=644221 RepID=A0A395JE68_9GAMM|nr:hypothetical protein [Arenicella xantha]RBP44828.1 hypothetical protein DFR28_1233 [Arenicella xantha]
MGPVYFWVVFVGILLMLPIQYVWMFKSDLVPANEFGNLFVVAILGFSVMCFIVVLREISEKFGKALALGYFILIAFPLCNILFYSAFWFSIKSKYSSNEKNI